MLQSITPDQLETLLKFRADVRILDVRKKPAFDADNCLVAGAEWRDPLTLDDWADDMKSTTSPVICYCVHGHQVSQDVARGLSARGIDAYYLRGGFDEWKLMSAPLMAKA